VRPSDTSSKAFLHQIALYQRAGSAQRSQIAAELSDAVRATTLASIRKRYPEYSDAEVAKAFLRAVYRVEIA
jgi:hypothetical protein